MFKNIFLVSFLLFFFPVFGEKAPEQKAAVSKEDVQIKEKVDIQKASDVQAKKEVQVKKVIQIKENVQVERAIQTKDKSEAPVPPVELKQNLLELMTYPEALEKYREAARLEWMGGVGVSSFEEVIFFPLVLEIQGSLNRSYERLKWLFQAGGILLKFPVRKVELVDVVLRRREVRLAGGELIVAPLLQAGLRYNFSRGAYGSLTAGPFVAFGDPDPFPVVLWTGGLLFGFGFGSDSFTMELGIQPFYQNRRSWDFGCVVNIKSVLKKWWSER